MAAGRWRTELTLSTLRRPAMVKAALQRLRNRLRKRQEVPLLAPSRGRLGTPKISVLGVDHTYANEVAALHDVTP